MTKCQQEDKGAEIETNTFYNEGFKRFFHEKHLTTKMIILNENLPHYPYLWFYIHISTQQQGY